MKKLFLAVPIFILSAFFSGCLHGDLEIDMGDGLTTKNAVGNELGSMGASIYPADYTITCLYYNPSQGYESKPDTVTGTITVTDTDTDTTTTTTYDVISVEFEYEEPDSSMFTSNCRRYGFKFKYIDGSNNEQELVYEKVIYTLSSMGFDLETLYEDTRLETYPGVTEPYGGVDAYYAFLNDEFDFIYEDNSYISYTASILGSSANTADPNYEKNIKFNCHFKRTSELSS